MSFMEHQVLGHKSPLYGRRTAQYKIKPFTYLEMQDMVPNRSLEECALIYGFTGGVVEYISHIHSDQSVDDAIIDLFYKPSGRLVEEPANLLKQELREPRQYNNILSAIENFSGASAYETYVKPMLPQFMGPVFERMVYEYVGYRIQRGTIPFIPHSYGTWWGADNTTKQQVEIDILALGESKPSPNTSPQPLALLGECKWRNEPVKPVILEKLIEKGRCIYGAAYYWLFSKSGYTFTNTNPDIELITLENMYKI